LTIQFNKNEDKVQQIHAEDEVKIINRGVTATGEMSIYYPETETLNMYRNVEILQNDNYVTCDELFLDIKNSTSIMKSNSAKRVEAFIISN
jgi:lipopolysaccharide export system protein LptA